MGDLFMITGPAGSGKTTLGRALASRLKAALLDLDDATEGLVREFLMAHPDRSEAAALRELRERRYAELAKQARARLLRSPSTDLILIAPFTAEISSLERWDAWLADLGVAPESAHLVWLTLPPAERLRRMTARGASRDARAVAEATTGAGLPESVPPVVPCLRVDAQQPSPRQVDRILQVLHGA